MADYNLNKKARLKLDPRLRFYPCSAGTRRLGYIRKAERDGTWLAIESIPGTKREKQVVIGLADDFSRADGEKILTVEQALEKVAAGGELVSAAGALTIEKAVKDYYERKAKSDPNAKQYLGQLTKYMTEALNRTRVDKLTFTQLDDWFADLLVADPKNPDALLPAKSTCNRVLGQLKAALNHAFKDPTNRIPSAAAWELVKGHEKAGKQRELDLTIDQVAKLIKAAASFDRDLATLMRATFLTGARAPGELAALDVRHFNAQAGRLQIQGRDDAPGTRSKTGSRSVILDAVSVAFFAECAKDKLPSAPLLTKDGARWPINGHYRDVKRAAELAELPSGKGGVCLYTLRHAHISRALESGVNHRVLADNCGTSVAMIAKHYEHLQDDFRNAEIQKHGPGAKLHAAA